ncbi:MAG: tetratricopeptide repeat protein [Cytophagaceae bacterium]|nr:tetratricopeptide repeat protein [Cytophagaceae bacterium]
MKKSFVIVVVLALASVGALYSLPKGLVQNDDKRKLATNQPPKRGSETPAQAQAAASKMHANALPAADQQAVNRLQGQFGSATGAEKIALADQLSEKLASLNRFDSAAYYAEQAALLDPSAERWLKTADQYYQAFTFAIDEAKGVKLAEKTREYYQKVLKQNPNLLTAKTNLAMTYMASETPMQGIALLREVLEQDPDNEGALFNLGMLSMRSNQYAKAVERFERILRNDANNARAQFYLGISYAELGRKVEARRWLESVRKLEKDPTIQAGVDEYLKKLEE